MSARFEVGELVDLAIRGARVVDMAGQGFAPLLALDVDGERLEVALSASLTVTRVAPKEWPPQSGDLWEDAHDGSWWAGPDDEGGVYLRSQKGGTDYPDWVLNNYGPMRLAYRRGCAPEPGPAAVEAEPTPVDDRAAKIQGLRELADWLEANPGVPFRPTGTVEIDIYPWEVLNRGYSASNEEQAEVLRNTAALIGADLREAGSGGVHGVVRKEFSGRVQYQLIHVLKKAPAGAPQDVTPAVGEVAGPDSSQAGPATAADEPDALPRLVEPAPIVDPALEG